jgi:protein SCO1/2
MPPPSEVSITPVQIGRPVPDAVLIDHEGQPLRISELRGRVVVLSFVYTHCQVSTMCPTTISKMSAARNRVVARGLQDVTFLLVSFDPERDDPERLRAVGEALPADDTLRMAVGSETQVGPLARALNTYYVKSTPGVFEHNIVVSVIDRDGILRDDLFGASWEVDELADAVMRVGASR